MIDDLIFWMVTIASLLPGFYAQSLIKNNYVRYSQVATSSDIIGAEVVPPSARFTRTSGRDNWV